MKQIILGTAGHIDHGKTSLVKALTGIDTDRLKEEKERGITIELGFAYLDLPSGQRLGIIDVPGHERFIKNMVAGASTIDLVALIIAADEGIMPQTREHLDICTLLGIKKGLVALTKIDMVEEDWLDLVQEDIKEFLKRHISGRSPPGTGFFDHRSGDTGTDRHTGEISRRDRGALFSRDFQASRGSGVYHAGFWNGYHRDGYCRQPFRGRSGHHLSPGDSGQGPRHPGP